MNTRKVIKLHKKLYKYFNKILHCSHKPKEKLNIYDKLLKVVTKLKSFEYKGKIKYKTPIYRIADVIENEKKILSHEIKNISENKE
jgi:hypothetical protein